MVCNTLGRRPRLCRYAVRRGWLADNPVAKLEPAEKPRRTAGQVSILEGHDLARLLDHACSYWPLFELLAYTGLRIGEALGLTWADIDHEDGLIHATGNSPASGSTRHSRPRPLGAT